MSTIAATNSSTGDALASLLRSNSAERADANAPTSAEANAAATRSDGPAVRVDLSDRAKAVLERNKVDQLVADRLVQQVSNVKNDGKPAAASKARSNDTSTLFDALSGRTASQAASGSSKITAELDSLIAAHRAPDGSVKSFTKTMSDFLTAPSTPAEIDAWYNAEGQTLIAGAQFFSEEAATGIAQAVQNREITIQNAKDIPGLNFQNTITFRGGEGGGGNSIAFSYNQNADIFKDPTTNYRVFSDGTVISWKKPDGDATLGVIPATGPIILNSSNN